MATLTGQAALDYIKKNGLGTTQEKQGILGSLLSGITRPFTNTVTDLAETDRYKNSKDRANYQTQFQDQGEFDKYKNKQGTRALQDIAGLASYIPIPGLGGAGILGKIGEAAISGGLYNASQADLSKGGGNAVKDIAQGALAGGATGGVLGLIGKAGGKLAQKGEQIAEDTVAKPSKLNQFFKDVRGSQLEVPYGKNEFNPLVTKRALQDNLGNRGLPRNLEGIMKGKELAGNELQTYIDDVMAKNPQLTRKGTDLFDQNFVDEMKSLAIGHDTDVSKLGEFFKGFTGVNSLDDLQNADFNVKDIAGMLQSLNKGLRDKSITGVRKDVAERMKSALMDKLTQDAPEYNNIAKEYAIYSKAENPTATKQMKGDQTASQNALQSALPISQAKNLTKRVIGAVGDNLTSGKLGTGKVATLASSLGDRAQQLDHYLTGMGVPSAQIAAILSTQLDGGQSDSQDNTDLNAPEASQGDELQGIVDQANKQQISSYRQQIYQQLLDQRDAKGVPQYTPKSALENADAYLQAQGYDTSIFDAPKEAKTPSAADRKVAAQTKAGLNALKQIRSILSKDKSVLYKSKLPGVVQDASTKQYLNALRTAAQNYGRIQSGGAISKDEEAAFMQLLPTLTNDSGTISSKLDDLESFFANAGGE